MIQTPTIIAALNRTGSIQPAKKGDEKIKKINSKFILKPGENTDFICLGMAGLKKKLLLSARFLCKQTDIHHSEMPSKTLNFDIILCLLTL